MPLVKRCYFVGPTKKILSAMPAEVKTAVGNSLYLAQTGKEADNAKVLKGFGGRGVLEVVEDFDGNAYRAVYTIRYSTGVYVLHVFQKKSKSGIATPKHEIELIKSRLMVAETHYRNLLQQGVGDDETH
ncbi:MAG TPA: type II toxin-antitoxin system RelE/ParE family toxin [Aestuariivirga sp.]|nr:type II toxin-antitoxin system RelE/ParE family toxin [Aestuariivirga sp.]